MDGGPEWFWGVLIGWKSRVIAARNIRREARARIQSAFAAQLDRVVPEDESVLLKGVAFADFEDQVEALA